MFLYLIIYISILYLSIRTKAARLKLKRNKKFLVVQLIKQNKSRGRDLTLKNLKIISKKYYTLQEFREKDVSAYIKAKKIGLDIVCKNLVDIMKRNISVPQLILIEIVEKLFNETMLINTKKIIKPYELDIFSKKYNIGFEYDGKYWHKNTIERDQLKDQLCKDNNILLIRIKENSKKYIIDIKKQLINHIDVINDITKLQITTLQITELKINIDFIKNKHLTIFNKYDSLLKFTKENYSLYRKLKKYNLVKKYCGHMKIDLPKSMKSPF